MDDERGVQRVFQIGSHAFRVGLPASRSHGLADTGGDVFAHTGDFQSVDQLHDGLQVGVVLGGNFVAVAYGGHHFRDVGGHGGQRIRVKIQVHGLIQHALVRAVAQNFWSQL